MGINPRPNPVKQNVKDAAIPNAVDPNSIQERLKTDNFVGQFIKQGAKLLEETNRPNILTLDQFAPFIQLFNMDVERYQTDADFKHQINRLYNRFIHGLGINLYEPTYVIRSNDDKTIVYFLNRRFTRIAPDALPTAGLRDTVPAAVARTADTTRDDLILQASTQDLVNANKTAEQMEYFRQIRRESAFVMKNFIERNLSLDKRDEILKGLDKEKTEVQVTKTTDGVENQTSSIILLDDDDD